MYREIKKCRICGNKNLKTITNLGTQKLTGIFPKPGERIEEGPLELVKCSPNDFNQEVCGLVQLKHSCDGNEMYGENYGYRSGLNKSMVEHLTEITSEIKHFVKLEDNDLVIDIGSNDSTLLRSYDIEQLDYIGMDPTGVKFRKYYPEYVELIPDFFSAENVKKARGDKKAKVVTSIAMFYDLEDPIKFAVDVNEVLADDGIWVMEQSYLPSMLEANSYDTICQEHLEFYCLEQIDWIVKSACMKVINVSLNDANGGSFRLVVAKEGSPFVESDNVKKLRIYERENKFNTLLPYDNFNIRINDSKKELLDFLRMAKNEGKRVYGYGASTKGNVLLQYCDITSEYIEAIAEVNEDKFGHVTPGTNIPIVSEEEAKAGKPDYFVVLPWHFRDNILEKERKYRQESGCKFVFPLPKLEIVDCDD